MMNSNNIPGKKDAVAGDILCAKEDGSKMVLKAEDYASISSEWTPIGVVVIPPSHDVYGTGEGAAVSLKYMNWETPDEGSTIPGNIRWGQLNVDTILTNFIYVSTTNNAYDPVISGNNEGYLPSNLFTGIQCVTDPIAYYYGGATYIPSPYLSDGSRNENYYTTEQTEYNALSDFDGIGNTNVLCSLATAQSDWRTASTITNNSGEGYSPAACCCWRYHTIGTNQGDWYLPAEGELGYLMVRLRTINYYINKIGGAEVSITTSYWSSSEYSNNEVRSMYTTTGYMLHNPKNTGGLKIRSFTRF